MQQETYINLYQFSYKLIPTTKTNFNKAIIHFTTKAKTMKRNIKTLLMTHFIINFKITKSRKKNISHQKRIFLNLQKGIEKHGTSNKHNR